MNKSRPDPEKLVRALVLLAVPEPVAREFVAQHPDGFENMASDVAAVTNGAFHAAPHYFAWHTTDSDLATEREGLVDDFAPLGIKLTLGDCEAYWGGETNNIKVTAQVDDDPPRCGIVTLAPDGDYFAAMCQLESILGPTIRIYAFQDYFESGTQHSIQRTTGWDEIRECLGDYFDTVFIHPSQIPSEFR